MRFLSRRPLAIVCDAMIPETSVTPIADCSEELLPIAAQTPARLWTGRAGVSYRTRTALELRRDHAAAVDAVHAELNLLTGMELSKDRRH